MVHGIPVKGDVEQMQLQVNIMLSTLAVIKEVTGGGVIPDRRVKVRQEEEQEEKCFRSRQER
jgi:hypothetical protein